MLDRWRFIPCKNSGSWISRSLYERQHLDQRTLLLSHLFFACFLFLTFLYLFMLLHLVPSSYFSPAFLLIPLSFLPTFLFYLLPSHSLLPDSFLFPPFLSVIWFLRFHLLLTLRHILLKFQPSPFTYFLFLYHLFRVSSLTTCLSVLYLLSPWLSAVSLSPTSLPRPLGSLTATLLLLLLVSHLPSPFSHPSPSETVAFMFSHYTQEDLWLAHTRAPCDWIVLF